MKTLLIQYALRKYFLRKRLLVRVPVTMLLMIRNFLKDHPAPHA